MLPPSSSVRLTVPAANELPELPVDDENAARVVDSVARPTTARAASAPRNQASGMRRRPSAPAPDPYAPAVASTMTLSPWVREPAVGRPMYGLSVQVCPRLEHRLGVRWEMPRPGVDS